MSLTIAQINSAVYVGLGSPDASVCSMVDIHNAVAKAVMLLTKQMRASDTNQPISVSSSFLITSSPQNVTTYIGKSTVAWLERQEGSRWKPVRVVPKAFLENYNDSDIPAAAFYSDEENRTYIDVSFPVGVDSTTIYRIWFDTDAVATTRATAVLIGDSFLPYVVMLAQNSLIARIKLKLAEQIENEEERKLLAVKLDAWNGLVAQNALEIPAWQRLWKREIHRNRTAQTQDRLPRKSGRALYGG